MSVLLPLKREVVVRTPWVREKRREHVVSRRLRMRRSVTFSTSEEMFLYLSHLEKRKIAVRLFSTKTLPDSSYQGMSHDVGKGKKE